MPAQKCAKPDRSCLTSYMIGMSENSYANPGRDSEHQDASYKNRPMLTSCAKLKGAFAGKVFISHAWAEGIFELDDLVPFFAIGCP